METSIEISTHKQKGFSLAPFCTLTAFQITVLHCVLENLLLEPESHQIGREVTFAPLLYFFTLISLHILPVGMK